MPKNKRTICKICGKIVQVGRTRHLVEQHRMMPPDKWLEEYGLPIPNIEAIADHVDKCYQEHLRYERLLFEWMTQHFDFDC